MIVTANGAGVATGSFTIPATTPVGTKLVEFTGAGGSKAAATFVGALTTAIGVSLLAAPVRTGNVLGIQADREQRSLG